MAQYITLFQFAESRTKNMPTKCRQNCFLDSTKSILTNHLEIHPERQSAYNMQAMQAPMLQSILQMDPPVMPVSVGYNTGCLNTYDPFSVPHYVVWSKYPEETIRDRNVL